MCRADEIVGRFGAVCAAWPERCAYESRTERITYGGLDRCSNLYASGLFRGGGAGPVAVRLAQGVELLAVLLGVLKSGRVAVVLDPAAGQAGALSILMESGATDLVVSDADPAWGPEVVPAGVRVWRVGHLGEGRGIVCPSVALDPEQAAFLLFTSGTTGRPKAVVRRHRGVVLNSLRLASAWGSAEPVRLCFVAAYSTGNGISNLFRALLSGGTILGFDVRAEGFDALSGWIRESGASELVMSASIFRSLASATPGRGVFPAVRLIRLGSEPVLRRDWDEYRRLFGPGCRFVNALSCTEAGTFTWHELGWEVGPDSDSVPIGAAMAGVTVWLVDAEGRRVEGPGVGEVVVGGAGLAGGYWRDAERTARAFASVAGLEGGSHYRTGDLGRRRADGLLEFVSRLDRRVRVRGLGVEPDGIEAVLLTDPAIEGAAICAREVRGGEHELTAFYAVRPGYELSPEEVRVRVRAHLPEQAVPGRCVRLESMPRSANGKPDRAALLALACEGGGLRGRSLEPVTELERSLAGLWGELLGVEGAGPESDFLESGGHSLTATQLLARVRSRHGVDVSLREFLGNPTLGWLALAVERAGRGAGGGAGVGGAGYPAGTGPASAIQRHFWMLDQMWPSRGAFHAVWTVRIRGELAVADVEASLEALERRHEMLRTSVPLVGEELVQRVDAAVARPWRVVRAEGFDAPERERAVGRVIAEEAWREFDLEGGRLWRVVLVRLAADEHVLLWVAHHVAVDRWSRDLMMRDWRALLAAQRAGLPSALAAPRARYLDHCHEERSHGARRGPEGLAYWRRQLSGAVRPVLPADRPACRGTPGAHGEMSGRLDAARMRGLEGVARQEGVSLYVVLLGVFQRLIGRVAGVSDVVTGSAISSRRHVEYEGVVGYFGNQMALRSRRVDGVGWAELWRGLWCTVIDGLEHREVPFSDVTRQAMPSVPGLGSAGLPVFFTLHARQDADVEVPGLMFEVGPVRPPSARSELVVTAIEEADGGMRFRWEYDAGLFEAGRVEGWMRAYDGLLEEAMGGASSRRDSPA